jgi:hypothetical protein
MKRDYETGESADVRYFVGVEVEKTPAHGMRTLFIVGFEHPDTIIDMAEKNNCKHIFFGANHSYKPHVTDDWEDWEQMINPVLNKGYLVSLDIPLDAAEGFLEGPMAENDNFIPQIRVPIPYAKLWNYNTMVKIDDKDFRATNPGVWCHSLHNLMDRDKFTDWNKYGLDKPIER